MRKLMLAIIMMVAGVWTLRSAEPGLEIGGAGLSQLENVSSLNGFHPEKNEFRIYFIGDSITRHGFNKDTIARLKWDHLAGMAASTEAKDYAHLVAAAVGKMVPDNKVKLFFGKGGDAVNALTGIADAEKYQPALVIVQLGEHVPKEDSREKIVADYAALMDALKALSSKPLIIGTGIWNPQRKVDNYVGRTALIEEVQAEVCQQKNVPFASVEKYALDPSCSGTGGSGGVRWHPNDAGMAGYAGAIMTQFKKIYQVKKAGKPVNPVITVDAGKTLGAVNRLVFGHNLEAADGRGIFSEAADAKKYDTSGIRTGQGYWNPDTMAFNDGVVAQTARLHSGMMRYPGGCLAHNFNWKKAVGPLAERGDWRFGVDEFIQLCRKLKVEPMITITDYALPMAEIPRHAAELVEYLNAPAIQAHPWAMKRKAWGHAEPYGVKWFELGNETDHGNHKCQPERKYTPEEYVRYANSTAVAMRAVDPAIKIGIVTVPGGGDDYGCNWNKTILKGAGANADYVVVHFYGPGVDTLNPTDCGKAAMAFAAQLEYRIGKYHDTIRECLQGKDLPLAVTEYNIGSTRNEPNFYRFSYTAGLMCADFMRLCLVPDSGIATANYWQILNGYWGAYTSRDGEILKRRATLPFFELWGDHFGDTLVAATVAGNRGCEAPATARLYPSHGATMISSRSLGELAIENFRLDGFESQDSHANSSGKDQFQVVFKGLSEQNYVEFGAFPRPATGIGANDNYRLKMSFDGRFVPAADNKGQAILGLGLGDSRGWTATQSAMAVGGIEKAMDWKSFSGDYITRPDCTGTNILVRFEKVSGKVSGKLEIRNLKVELYSVETFPAYPALTVCSSLSKDGNTMYLMVFNKNTEAPVTAEILLKNFNAAGGRCFELYQPDMASLKYFQPQTSEVKMVSGVLTRTFPPHSMTAIEIYRKIVK